MIRHFFSRLLVTATTWGFIASLLAQPAVAQPATSAATPPDRDQTKPPVLIVDRDALHLGDPSQLVKELSAAGLGVSTAADSREAKGDVRLEAALRFRKDTRFADIEALARLLARGGVERIAFAYQDEEGLGITLIADKHVRAGSITSLMEDLQQFQKRHGENTTFSLKVKPESKSNGGNPFDAHGEAEPEPSPRVHAAPKEAVSHELLKSPLSVHLQKAPLGEVIISIQKVANVNLQVDEQGLQEAGVTIDTRVSINVDEMPLESVLTLLLEPLKLGYVVQNDVLKITSERRAPQTAARLKSRYEAEERAIAELARQIRDSKTPDDARRTQLRTRVAKAFALRQAQQQAELQEFRDRMLRVEATIQSREQSRERIIDRRVEELLDPRLRWEGDVPAAASLKPSSKPGSPHSPAIAPRVDPAQPHPSKPKTTQISAAVSPLAALQGEWILKLVGVDDLEHVPDEAVVRIEGGTWVERVNGSERRFRMELASADHQNGFNLIGRQLDGTYITRRGLFIVDGTLLWTYFSEDPGRRPRQFRSQHLPVTASLWRRKDSHLSHASSAAPLLEGEWLLTSIKGNGVLGWETGLKLRVIDDQWIVLRQNFGTAYQLKIDPQADPMTIDLHRDGAKPSTMRGLIRFADAELHLFWSTKDESVRPTGYDDPDANRHTYRLVKAGPIAMRAEQARFEGRWRQVGRIVDGKDVLLSETRLEIRDMHADGVELRINPVTRPRQFTAVREDGQPSQRGIYEWLSGPGLPQDHLRLCQFTDESRGPEYPKDFGPGPGVQITEWEREPETPISRLQGEWTLESTKGWETTASLRRQYNLRIAGDEWTWSGNRREKPMRIELVPDQHPQAINLVGEPEDRPAFTLQALYQLDGDTLSVSFQNNALTERPKAFDAPDLMVYTYRRRPDSGRVSAEFLPGDPLDGDWKLDSITGDGVAGTPGGLTVHVERDSWIVKINGQHRTTHQMELNPEAVPPTIDLSSVNSDGNPEIQRGLYRLEGTTLRTYWRLGNLATRPTAYDAPGVAVHTYHLLKPGTGMLAAEQQRFEGQWLMVSASANGKDIVVGEPAPFSIHEMLVDGGKTRLQLDLTADPRRMHITSPQAEPIQAIYEWISEPGETRDRLRICRLEDPKRSAVDRPHDFTPGPGVVIAIWERLASEDSETVAAAAEPHGDSAARPVRLEFVCGEKKQPIPDLTVRLVRIDRKLGRVRGGIGEADEHGIARLSLAPAHYAATVESKTPLHYLPIPVGWKEIPSLAAFHFTVEPGATEQPFTFHLAAPCRLTLRAVDEVTGDGLAGAVFATENALGEYWAQVINADTLGAPQLRESDFTDETLQTDSNGTFTRELGPRPGWKYLVWTSPKGYEPSEPGKEVTVETPLGQETAEYTFKFRKLKGD